MAETRSRTVTIGGRRHELGSELVERAMQTVLPEPITSHYVVINQRRYPPKQVIGRVTGLDRADFTTHHARRVLMRLGFAVGRTPSRGAGSSDAEPRAAAGLRPAPSTPVTAAHDSAEALRPFLGQWVAVKDEEVLVAADSPRRVVAWLAANGQRADSMFRVPEDELAASGLAPL
jgi:hypothetical protein